MQTPHRKQAPEPLCHQHTHTHTHTHAHTHTHTHTHTQTYTHTHTHIHIHTPSLLSPTISHFPAQPRWLNSREKGQCVKEHFPYSHLHKDMCLRELSCFCFHYFLVPPPLCA